MAAATTAVSQWESAPFPSGAYSQTFDSLSLAARGRGVHGFQARLVGRAAANRNQRRQGGDHRQDPTRSSDVQDQAAPRVVCALSSSVAEHGGRLLSSRSESVISGGEDERVRRLGRRRLLTLRQGSATRWQTTMPSYVIWPSVLFQSSQAIKTTKGPIPQTESGLRRGLVQLELLRIVGQHHRSVMMLGLLAGRGLLSRRAARP